MLKALARSALHSWPFFVPVRTKTGAAMFVDLRYAVGQSIFARGEFDPVVRDAILPILKEDSIFIDVGANIGFYSVEAAQVITKGQIHAFEMDPRSTRCLRATVRKQKLDRLIVHQIAVHEHSGTIRFKAEHEPGHSYIAAGGDRETTCIALDEWMATTRPLTVTAIKIDVEGGEVSVLKGATKLIDKFHPFIIIEAEPNALARSNTNVEELFRFFRERGYFTQFLEKAWSKTVVAT